MNLLHRCRLPIDPTAHPADLAAQLEESIENLDYTRSIDLAKVLRRSIEANEGKLQRVREELTRKRDNAEKKPLDQQTE